MLRTRPLSGIAGASFVLAVLVAAACAGKSAPSQFVRTANESGIWKSIEISAEGQPDKSRLWSTAVDALSSKYDLEVLDKESGYLRTGWKFTSVSDRKEEREQYRSRLVAKFNQGWTVLQVKSEAQWLERGVWVNGYDTQVLNDVYGDLQGRLGRTAK